MATFKDIEKANATIKTTNIKGKDYAEVNQRIKAFRMLYPDGYIRTEIIESDFEQIIYDNPKEHVIIKSPQKKFMQLPKYKSLWFSDDNLGLPIGNLTSQFFSNIYL